MRARSLIVVVFTASIGVLAAACVPAGKKEGVLRVGGDAALAPDRDGGLEEDDAGSLDAEPDAGLLD